MSRSVWCGFIVLLMVVSGVSGAYAQSNASISGVVKDSAGGVVPGVSVIVKDDATGNASEAVTGADGRYQVTALGAGSYTVTASLAGFKTAVAKGVRLAPGQPVTVTLTLDVGQLSETVTVMSSSELINTETATVAATLNSDQLTRMPTPTRNALNAITFLPGVNTPGTNRDSTINGLPEGFLSITLDGVSNNDNFLRNTDSFFASVTPRQDAVEAVSVTLAASGATAGAGAGAVTMAFQTRSGGNKFSGSLYEYYRNPKMNTPYIFNIYNHLPINQVKLSQYGGRVGGPIMIPGLFNGRDKAFFFVHYEEIVYPNSFTRTRTVFNSAVYSGVFRWQCATGVCEKNLLDLARANGQIATIDPTMAKIMSMIDAATKTTGTRTAQDPLYDTYVFNSPATLFEQQPTVRLDYNLTSKHRLSGTWSVIRAKRTPDYLNSADPRFPGAPNQRDFKSVRPLLSLSVRSVLSKSIINELRGGATAYGSGSTFGQPAANASRNAPSSFADQGGFAITTPTSTTDWYTSNGPSWRTSPTYTLDETLTWQKRAHTMTFGASGMISNADSGSQQMVSGIRLGFDTNNDPANAMFTGSGIDSSVLSSARAVYAVLTGRVTSINSAAVLDASGKYVELGPVSNPGGIKVFTLFAQDSWKATPTLTFTGGVRWEVQTPFAPSANVMSSVTMASVCGVSGPGSGGLYSKCKFLTPGATGGVTPQFVLLEKGTEGYKQDWNNVGPSVSVAWRPNRKTGLFRTILGDPDQATLRAGFNVSYERQGLTVFTSLYGGNPGGSTTLTRNANAGLVPAGESWPVLLSQPSRLYSASFNPDPSYPIAIRANRVDSLNAFAPDIQIARVNNWMIGFARSLSKDTALEIRYIGNHGYNQWSSLNYNQIRGENLVANGFMNEFKLAMANLTANNAAAGSNPARLGSFAYFGSGTGTSPLPIYLAYLNGSTDYNNAAAYTGGSSTFSSTTIAGRLVASNPNPTTAAATDLDGTATRRANAAKVGYPANFFVLNPDVNNVNVTDSGAFSNYNALQIELRRRLSHGLSASINYQFAAEGGSSFDGFSFGRVMGPSANVRHAIKMQWDWTLPFGRGQRFGRDVNPIANLLIGGWSVNGVGRMQTVMQDLGNVRLVGMTKSELQKMYKYYTVDASTSVSGLTEIWMLPPDVILNTRRAFNTSPTTVDGYSTSLGAPSGKYLAPANSAACVQVRAGDCAPRNVLLLAPWFYRFDMGVTKRIDIHGSMNMELRLDVLNVFDRPNYNPAVPSTTTNNSNYWGAANNFKVTSAYTDASNTYDPGGRIGQLMVRFTW
ncbi:MAG: carboxypeptidase regulatory-like domain-containing protein [Acidobacteria bacterium]|nr:carboxypeptidase regulatory-like domain-containing protein [Acidobacteriota bacterium]